MLPRQLLQNRPRLSELLLPQQRPCLPQLALLLFFRPILLLLLSRFAATGPVRIVVPIPKLRPPRRALPSTSVPPRALAHDLNDSGLAAKSPVGGPPLILGRANSWPACC